MMMMMMMMMMESPVGTTYELRPSSVDCVCPHVGCKADPSSATSAADCADQVARWGCVFGAGVCHKSLATSALLYLDSNAVLLKVLHTGVTDFVPFRSVAGECLPVSWVYAGGLHVSLHLISVALQWATKSPRTGRKFRVEDSLRDPAARPGTWELTARLW